MEIATVLILVFVSSLISIGFALVLIRWLFKQPQGTSTMKQISSYIQEGAWSYLKQQYKVVGIFFIVVFCLLFFMAKKNLLSIFVPFAFFTGGFWSALCGFIGMFVATRTNSRTTYAASLSLNRGLKVAFGGGTVMGLMVVGLGLFDLVVWFAFLKWCFAHNILSSGFDEFTTITQTMLCFGMGASSYALFARVGGGIYTKAADVGADLVGKVEAGIPEDDPRNPAVIADLVGDNVGDVAGMGADLYESYVGSIVATMSLAAAAGLGFKGVSFPMIIASAGVIASILGFFLIKTKREEHKDLINALRRGVFSAAGFIVIGSAAIVGFLFGKEYWGIWGAVIAGLIAGVLLGVSTEYFTSASFSPTKKLSKSALTGPATIIISGISLGMLSTALPILFICAAVFFSFYFAGGFSNYNIGLYGIGIAAVGLLSTLGITLASDAYGPIADNAGGIAQMSDLDKAVRKRTDQLDSLGNTTAATGKGFAIGSAALTALALIVAYKERVEIYGGSLDLSLLDIKLLIGLFLGGVMPFIFCSLTLGAVGRAAEFIVQEVRRQFRQITGLLEGRMKADYSTCVKITTAAAQRKMILPALLAIIAPIAVGLLLGAEAVAGLLVGSLISGFVLAVMMANSGGAWDNAKKYIEEGNLGGKGSDSHKAAVVGDTVGDPFKDTSGPSLNILLKLMSMVSIVFSQFILTYSILK
ncbi:MAG: sodium-translocating pyrophosphatase [Candidatus Omnitrophota bacterium]|nr:MAG: sodium-translocating pyrophosphatase [Candidatus Omnitrophota bacterium]